MTNDDLDAQVIRLDDRRDRERIWIAGCITGETGKPLPVLANVLIGLRAVWPDAFAWDEMLCAPILMRALDGANDCAHRPVTDVDVGLVQDRLQHLRTEARSQGYRSPSSGYASARMPLPPRAELSRKSGMGRHAEGWRAIRTLFRHRVIPTIRRGHRPNVFCFNGRACVSARLQGRPPAGDRGSAGHHEKCGLSHHRRRMVL